MSLIFYKPFVTPRAIGFDLDDTLYDNQPVLKHAEKQLQLFLNHHYPKSNHLLFSDWLKFRQHAISTQSTLNHDISASRKAALYRGLIASGYDEEQANEGAKRAMAEFLTWRNSISIAPQVHRLLAALKQHYRLFAISNGNADIEQFGLAQYFEFSLRPSVEIPMKPASRLFNMAQQKLGLPATEICYVGDHPVSDVVGASRAGWQSIWLNSKNIHLDHYKKPLQLPTLEINSVLELSELIPR